MRFADLVATSQAVARAGGRLEKIALLASLLKRAAPEEIEIATAFLSGTPRQGRIGLGGAALHAARDTPPADDARPRAARRRQCAGDIHLAFGPGSTRDKADDAETAARAARPATSKISSCASSRATCGRGRSKACSSTPWRARRIYRRAGSPRRDAGRCAAPGGTRRAGRRRRGAVAVPASTVSATSADARRFGGRCWRCDDDAWRGGARIQDRWRAHPGPQGRR